MVKNFNKALETPVLFISFARPQLSRLAFEAIKKVKPKSFYFHSNAPSTENKDEVERNTTIRNFSNEIDWECSLKTFFRDKPVDVYTSLFGAIDWVFQHEDKAIIVEEDCRCSKSFFYFCEDLLNKYENEERVWMISGNNYHDEKKYSNHSFFFSRYMHIYGWATWKNRWQKIDRSGKIWEEMKRENLLFNYFQNKKEGLYHFNRFERFVENISVRPAWDVLFYMSMIENRSYGIVPTINLAQNMGTFGIHSRGGDNSHNITAKEINGEILYPKYIIPNSLYDDVHFRKHWHRNANKWVRAFRKIKLILNSFFRF